MNQNQRRQRQSRQNPPEDDMQSVILDLARVTRVQKGGKRLRFRVCLGVGDGKGQIGIGIAKGPDVAGAVEKATRRAKKDIIVIPLTETKTILHTIEVKYKAARILLKPAPSGTGVKAGGVVRVLCTLAGIQNISAKLLGSNNKITNAQAIIKSFKMFK